MEEPVFDVLRTQEQLGYNVYATLRNTFGVLGFSITVDFQVDKFRYWLLFIYLKVLSVWVLWNKKIAREKKRGTDGIRTHDLLLTRQAL
jgi:hypothetical protein